MQTAILVAVTLLALISSSKGGNVVQNELVALAKWARFLREHNKAYSSTLEMQSRFEIFKQNLVRIQEYQESDPDAEYGVTEFADLTEEEFSIRLGFKGNADTVERRAGPELRVDAPEEWDWRKYNVVTPVKNQGQCGSCWAFSTTGNLEGLFAVRYKELANISEQQLVDCDSLDSGCNGGLMENAFAYVSKNGGIETEENYPYLAVDAKCHADKTLNIPELVVNNSTMISTDEGVIAETLVNTAPLSVALNATPLQFYVKGVFNPVFCNPKNLNHGVLIVGYGISSGGIPFWIVKNSWGTKWGEQGYFRIKRGAGKCGINTYVITANIK